MADQVIVNSGVCLQHKGSIIGVQCQLVVCRKNTGVLMGTSKIIVTDGLMVKLMSNSGFFSLFQIQFKSI